MGKPDWAKIALYVPYFDLLPDDAAHSAIQTANALAGFAWSPAERQTDHYREAFQVTLYLVMMWPQHLPKAADDMDRVSTKKPKRAWFGRRWKAAIQAHVAMVTEADPSRKGDCTDMASIAFAYAYDFQAFDKTELKLPVSAPQMGNLLAGKRFGAQERTNANIQQAYCVALWLLMQCPEHLPPDAPDAKTKAFLSADQEKRPAWRLFRWKAAMEAHTTAHMLEMDTLS